MLDTTPQSTAWSELEPAKRGLTLLDEIYGETPIVHLEQIRRIHNDSLPDMNRWLDKMLPVAPSADQLGFPESRFLKLDESSWNTEQGVQSVRHWLHESGTPYSTIAYLFYDRTMILSMPWKIVLRYWKAWAWSVGYSMIAVDSTCQWACMFHHENVIEFGRYAEQKTEQSDAPKSPVGREF